MGDLPGFKAALRQVGHEVLGVRTLCQGFADRIGPRSEQGWMLNGDLPGSMAATTPAVLQVWFKGLGP